MTSARKSPPRSATTRGAGRASVSAETTGSDARPAETTTAAQLRELREAAGLTLTELGRRVAALTSTSAEAWRVALTDYEAGRKVPSSDRVSSILDALGATPAAALRWELWSRLRPEQIGELVERYGLDATADAIETLGRELRGPRCRLPLAKFRG